MISKNIVKVFSWLALLSFYGITFWAWIDRFELQSSKSSVKPGEAFDLTIKAVDKDWAVVSNYNWSVLIFSDTDNTAELPASLTDSSYTFKAEDQWVVKFENAIKFKKEWAQNLNVFDLSNEEVFGTLEIMVSNEATQAVANKEISINYPVDWTTTGEKNIKINWKTEKNHKVVINIDSKTKVEVISNSDGVFETELKDLESWKHTINAEILDADDKTIWKSKDVIFTINAEAPKLKSIKITPNEELKAEQKVSLEIVSDEDLTTVRATLNDVVKDLTQTEKKWVYTTELVLPKEEGNYKIDVTLKNELGVEFKQNWALEVAIKPIELPAAQEVKTEVNCDDFKKELIVNNPKVVTLKTKSVLSWDKVDKASSYNIYKKDRVTWEMKLIENIENNSYEVTITWDKVEYDDFAIKAVFKDEVCEVESTDFAEMTKVQTGPKEVAMLILALSLGLALILRRKKA